MEGKYNYLESIAPLLLSHGMAKNDNVIYCELSDKEKLLILEFIYKNYKHHCICINTILFYVTTY